MKRKLPSIMCAIGILFFSGLKAQEYQQLTFSSGLNADVIANGVGTAMASTTIGVDNANFAFVSNDFQLTASSTAPSYGLPSAGVINSLVTTGLSYQIASYTGNNVLRLPLQNNTGTLAISNGTMATKIFMLVTSGSGISTMTGVITFTDDTTQAITTSTVPDWYNSTTLPIAASGFGRVNRANSVLENTTGNPRMYQLEVAILPANQTKTISSIQLTKTSVAEGVINIFSITAQVLPTCPSPTGLSTDTTATTATVNWNAPVIMPGSGYDYYVSTTTTAPTATTTPSGNIAAGTNSVLLSGLITGEQYYFWVRSNCSETEKGTWVATTFTTGQVTSLYTGGTISTLYNVTPTITSTTTCPGTLSVTVPEGFQVASVATAYTMSTASNGYMSEQRSLLVCTTSNITEPAVISGVGATTGTYNYSRSGLTIANGLTGTVQFELRAWRTYGGTGCNTTYNMVNNNSWTVTITYEPIPCTTPANPVALAQSFCNGATVSQLVATGATGAQFNWYASETEGDVLLNNAVITSGTYYVSQTIGTCESEKTAVAVIVNTTAVPGVTESQTLCNGAIVGDLMNTATGEVKWYLSPTASDALLATDILASGTYYITQTIDDCESNRTAVTVVINTTAVPTPGNITVCSGITMDGLLTNNTGQDIYTWYQSENSGIIAGTELAVSGTFYLTTTVNNCESEAVAVEVTVNQRPDLPTGSSEQTFTPGETIADLEVVTESGHIVTWYVVNNAGGFEPVQNTALLTDGITYYVTQTQNDCDSEMFAITATQALSAENFKNNRFKIYPNPAETNITVSTAGEISQISVYNMLGQKLINNNVSGNNIVTNISDLPSGNYVLQVTASGKTETHKFIKK